MVLPDTDLVSIATEFRDAIVGSTSSTRQCAIVCYPLAGYLHFLGITVYVEVTLLRRTTHVWIRLPDGRALDPTVDQFDPSLPPVYLGPRLEMHYAKRRTVLPRPRRRS